MARRGRFTPGRTVFAFLDVLRAIRDGGHEIGHHGWVHENSCTLTPDQERIVIEKGLEALQKVAGVRPTGFRSPAWTKPLDRPAAARTWVQL